MRMIIAFGLVGCEPTKEEVQDRRVRRWRLIILILVACAVAGLTRLGYPVEGALVALAGVVSLATMTARYVLGPPAPSAAQPAQAV